MADINAATQRLIPVEDIREDVVFLKNGGLRKVLVVSGINFDLRSEQEQEIILSSFQSFLNGLDFPIQFFIHSRKINISSYLEKIQQRRSEEENELLKIQIDEYMEFIRSFVAQNPIITKNFFAVVPYDPVVSAQDAKKGLFGLFGKKTKETEESTGKSVQQLNYRVAEVEAGLEQIGLRVSALEKEELVELLYNLYNPEFVEKQGIEVPFGDQ